MPGKKVGELRIHDTIGGCDNLRIIFFCPDVPSPLPTLWILAVLQKKRDDFTKNQLRVFSARRTLVLVRFYQGL